MAMMSSATASVLRNTRTPEGMRSPSSERTPRANAMSVAVGMPQPLAVAVPKLKATKMRMGATTPPAAAMIGRIA